MWSLTKHTMQIFSAVFFWFHSSFCWNKVGIFESDWSKTNMCWVSPGAPLEYNTGSPLCRGEKTGFFNLHPSVNKQTDRQFLLLQLSVKRLETIFVIVHSLTINHVKCRDRTLHKEQANVLFYLRLFLVTYFYVHRNRIH